MQSVEELRELLEQYISSNVEPTRTMAYRMDVDPASLRSFRSKSRVPSYKTVEKIRTYLQTRVNNGDNQ